MNEKDIRKYAGLMKELGLTALEITEDKKAIRMECTAMGNSSEHVITSAVPSFQREKSADYISVKSLIVGVFYAAPAENAEPFVTIGDRVEKGKTLCVIEAMKLMNEICAEEGGEIAEICVTNGQIVEYGTELFKMRR